MKRVPATENSTSTSTPPHFCIAFTSSSSRSPSRPRTENLAQGFHGAFSTDAQTHFVLPAYFRAMCGRTLLPRHIFDQCANALCFPGAFSGNVRTHFVLPAHFRPMRKRTLLSRSVCRKAEPCLRVFLWKTRGLLALAHCFPRSFLGFARVRTAFPACFWAMCGRTLLPRYIFWQCAGALCFPGAFSTDAQTHFVLPAYFRPMRKRTLLPRHIFDQCANALCSPGAFSTDARTHFAFPERLSQRDALLTSFCLLALLAFCRKAEPCLPSFPAENSCLLRQKAQKLAGFLEYSRCFPGAFSGNVRAHFASP